MSSQKYEPQPKRFQLQEPHIDLIREANVVWQPTSRGFNDLGGTITLDPYCPYGTEKDPIKAAKLITSVSDDQTIKNTLGEIATAMRVVLNAHNLEPRTWPFYYNIQSGGQTAAAHLSKEQVNLLKNLNIITKKVGTEDKHESKESIKPSTEQQYKSTIKIPSVDAKKPYGNGDTVFQDMFMHMGQNVTRELYNLWGERVESAHEKLAADCAAIQQGLVTAMQVVFQRHKVTAGTFQTSTFYNYDWTKVS